MSKYSTICRRLRKDYTYSAEQLQDDFGIHPQTLRRWAKDKVNPLPLVQQRPTFVFSEELRTYLAAKDKARKTRLKATELYCFKCKVGKQPLENKAHFAEAGAKVYVHAICPTCGTKMHKAQSRKKLSAISPFFERVSLADLHILGRAISNENAHLGQVATSSPSEPSTDTHLYKVQTLL